jgi:hypothetical protein
MLTLTLPGEGYSKNFLDIEFDIYVFTNICMIHRGNEENKPHRNKDVVAMYCGHVFS